MRNFHYNELTSRSWDSEVIGLVAQIHEYKGRQELYLKQKPAELDRLIEVAKVQSTEASNEIEGIRTTNTRLMQLVRDKTTPRNRDEEEIMGYRDVLNTIHENYEYIPITSNYILQLHRDLYQYSHKSIGGTFKNTQNYISATDSEGREFVLFTPLAPYETPSAIDAICESYNRYYHLAYSYVHNPDDASDIVQNGAYLAIKNSASLRQPEYAATWIYRIMLNEIFHHLKRPDTISYEDSLIAEGKPDQYQDLDLRTALDSLSPEDKAIVELRYFEDLKIEDIARVLNENVNTIKSRLYRSMQKLKLKMEVTE